ncbi:MAG: CapA family protein [Candidatus Limnocylindrales bacterium]
MTDQGAGPGNKRFMAWPSGGPPRGRDGRGRRILAAGLLTVVVGGVAVGAVWLGGKLQSPRPSSTAPDTSSPGPTTGASSSPSPTATATAPQAVDLAVVVAFDDYKVNAITRAQLKTRLEAGSLIVPCGAEAEVAHALGSTGQGAAPCVAADAITARLGPGDVDVALIPPALVTPRVKVVPLESADLFGPATARTLPYPLTIKPPATWPAAWADFAANDVRVVVTTGVNCPDTSVAYQTITKGRGWAWLGEAGTARIAGTHFDTRFDWTVVEPVRTGHVGVVKALVRGADVAMSDFECPMTKAWKAHSGGTTFTIDPRVAQLMADFGFDVATIASDHMSNAGAGAVGETVDAFRAAGVQPTGGGRNLDDALMPAVIDANGITFGFVGFNAIGGSTSATASRPGTANLTSANVKAAVARARAAGAQVVIALVQWSDVEYQPKFTDFQLGLVKTLFDAGVDHIVGDDFHWAGAVDISLSGSRYRYVGASQGNFWFGQDWSRQTQEGVITSLTFVGTRLVQVRLQPTVLVDNAQPNLEDPATDGQFVLKQVLSVSSLPAR